MVSWCVYEIPNQLGQLVHEIQQINLFDNLARTSPYTKELHDFYLQRLLAYFV